MEFILEITGTNISELKSELYMVDG